MNKFQIGDRVKIFLSYYRSEIKPPKWCSETIIGIIKDLIQDDLLLTEYKGDNNKLYTIVVHSKSCRRLVKKKRECPHPHITREKLAEAWTKLNGWESSPWRVDESEMFKFLCQELGL